MDTRADIAHLAATGYELDTTVFTDEDRETVKAQVEEYKTFEDIILKGDVYRIDSPFNSNFFTQMVVSKDKSNAILTVYRRLSDPNPEHHRICLAGLDKDKTYHIEGLDITAKGSTLMNVGIIIKYVKQDFWSETYRVTEVK
jgi:alpha-galactosidase